MSRRVERFFHIRPGQPDFIATKGGATVRVVGDVDDDNNHIEGLTFQVTYCSANDAFCRKTGREWATSKPLKTITVNDLPGELQRVAREVLGSKGMKLSRTKRQQNPMWNQDYSFATKYWQVRVPMMG